MTSLSHTYADDREYTALPMPRVRYGGPRRQFDAPMPTERNDRYGKTFFGSHMPIDTDIHWTWRNPLNILPALIVLIILLDVVTLVLA